MDETGPGARAPAPVHPARPARVQAHLSRWLMAYAIGAIAAGLAAGYPARSWAGHHSGSISTWTTVAVFLVIYPMTVNLRVEAMVRAATKPIFQVLLMVGYVKLAPRVRDYYIHGRHPQPALATSHS